MTFSKKTAPIIAALVLASTALRPMPVAAAEDVEFVNCGVVWSEAISKSVMTSSGGQLLTTGAPNCSSIGLTGTVAESGWVYTLYGYGQPWHDFATQHSYTKFSSNVIEVAGSHNTCVYDYSACNTNGWESTLIF